MEARRLPYDQSLKAIAGKTVALARLHRFLRRPLDLTVVCPAGKPSEVDGSLLSISLLGARDHGLYLSNGFPSMTLPRSCATSNEIFRRSYRRGRPEGSNRVPTWDQERTISDRGRRCYHPPQGVFTEKDAMTQPAVGSILRFGRQGPQACRARGPEAL